MGTCRLFMHKLKRQMAWIIIKVNLPRDNSWSWNWRWRWQSEH